MTANPKIVIFDLIVHRLTEWYVEAGGSMENNDLSKLKLIKMLFFVCASTSSKESKQLLEVFDKFVAMPYGHVESDVYRDMAQSSRYNITKFGLEVIPSSNIPVLSSNLLERGNQIDQSIQNLKKANFDLVIYKPFQLVDLSHKWQSWKTIFSLAKMYGKNSMQIPVEMIMTEPKVFS